MGKLGGRVNFLVGRTVEACKLYKGYKKLYVWFSFGENNGKFHSL